MVSFDRYCFCFVIVRLDKVSKSINIYFSYGPITLQGGMGNVPQLSGSGIPEGTYTNLRGFVDKPMAKVAHVVQ